MHILKVSILVEEIYQICNLPVQIHSFIHRIGLTLLRRCIKFQQLNTTSTQDLNTCKTYIVSDMAPGFDMGLIFVDLFKCSHFVKKVNHLCFFIENI